eukprot:SAG31_NODE_2780_length_5098_cov_2.124000_2_plen_116_part_00
MLRVRRVHQRDGDRPGAAHRAVAGGARGEGGDLRRGRGRGRGLCGGGVKGRWRRACGRAERRRNRLIPVLVPSRYRGGAPDRLYVPVIVLTRYVNQLLVSVYIANRLARQSSKVR